MKFIVLDSTPLSLITQRRGVPQADACKKWMAYHASRGIQIFVPEIVDYELRRELLRLQRAESIGRLDRFLLHPSVRYEPLNTAAIRRAAALWAEARQQGIPTADPHALDVDVILAAQTLASGIDTSAFVVATSNFHHLAHFVPAKLWQTI